MIAPPPAQPPPVVVVWPPERLPRSLVVNGSLLPQGPGRVHRFEGTVRFGAGAPVRCLEGPVTLAWTGRGWLLRWTAPPEIWVAAAVAGELGEGALFEARRALAAVLRRWLEGPGRTRHPRGVLCPLTHCAVVRGRAGDSTRRAVQTAPVLELDPRWCFFTGSAGGAPLSPRAVWGEGPDLPGSAAVVPGDRWQTWERTFDAAQVAHLKGEVPPGLRPGQRGLHLGASGPYAVEDLRLAAGRAYGWTAWPSNACTAEPLPGGGLRVRGRGWGHATGLCLASALHWAQEGWSAEQILEAAYGSWRRPVPEGR